MFLLARSSAVSVLLLSAAFQISGGTLPDTKLSLAKPARVPGATLKPGQYTIQVLDQLQDRFVLAVKDAKHAKPLTTFLAIPNPKLPHAGGNAAVYWPKSGSAPAIRGVWLLEAVSGAEFVFPKADAAKLARQAGEAVPAVDPDSEGKKVVSKMEESDRQVVSLWLLSAVAVTPDGKKMGIQASKFVPPAEAQTAISKPAPVSVETARSETHVALNAPVQPMNMPKTAGNFAAKLLAGLALLGTGATLMRRIYSAQAANRY